MQIFSSFTPAISTAYMNTAAAARYAPDVLAALPVDMRGEVVHQKGWWMGSCSMGYNIHSSCSTITVEAIQNNKFCMAAVEQKLCALICVLHAHPLQD
eukprot:14366694-Ditylum_brightwellii.AAC.1